MAKAVKAIANNVEEYINGQPGNFQFVLNQLRQAILKGAPRAEEIISYQIPTYKHKGPLVHFAAFKDHCSLIIINRNIIRTFEKELKNYKTTGTTIHFTPENPIPSALVKKIVKIRIKDNEEREALKTSAKK